MPRPKRYDDAVIDIAGPKIAEILKQWVRDCGDAISEEDEAGYLEDGRTLARDAFGKDGHQLAKEADSLGYDSDMNLAQELDSAFMIVDEAHAVVLRKWIAKEGIAPLLKRGDKVKAKRADFKSEEIREGLIVDVLETRGQYCVCIPSLGHTPPGETPKNKSMVTHGSIFDWEVVEKWQEEKS